MAKTSAVVGVIKCNCGQYMFQCKHPLGYQKPVSKKVKVVHA